MRQGIKRPIQAYLLQGLWIAVVLYWSTTNSYEIGQWILAIGAIAGIISLGYMIVRSNYFEITDHRLVINEGIFRKKTIDLDKIEKSDIEPMPF